MMQPNYINPYHQPYKRPNAMSTASLIMGILSLPGICFLGIGGFIFGALGILFAILSKSREPMESNSKIGLGLSIAGVVLSFFLFLMILMISAFQSYSSSDQFPQLQFPQENNQLPFEDYEDYYNNHQNPYYNNEQTVPESPWQPLNMPC